MLGYLFGDVLTALQVVVSIGEDFRLHNGNNTILQHIKNRQLNVNTGRKSCVDVIPVSKLTPTCWQMLAYRARTLAFSNMASSDGVVLLIFSTLRHLAKSAPSFLYCAQRSDSPSRPAHQHEEHAIRNRKEFRQLPGVQCVSP